MKWGIAIFLAFLAGFFLNKPIKSLFRPKSETYLSQRKVDFVSSLENKPIVVIIPSYNNATFCERNLRSVFSQQYSNFRIIYIDDASTDGMQKKVKELIDGFKYPERITFLRNSIRRGAMENLYHAIHSCSDEEIVALLDGDDWLAHENVLEQLNGYYANPEVWMTYGNYLQYPHYDRVDPIHPIPREVIAANALRKYISKKAFILGHLRTFYAGLFKKIKREDFEWKGNFLESSCDIAILIPLAEMASKHVFFVKDILYIYNRTNPLNDDKVGFEKQQSCMRHVLQLSPYQPLENWWVAR